MFTTQGLNEKMSVNGGHGVLSSSIHNNKFQARATPAAVPQVNTQVSPPTQPNPSDHGISTTVTPQSIDALINRSVKFNILPVKSMGFNYPLISFTTY